jgi:hypothetical protein
VSELAKAVDTEATAMKSSDVKVEKMFKNRITLEHLQRSRSRMAQFIVAFAFLADTPSLPILWSGSRQGWK